MCCDKGSLMGQKRKTVITTTIIMIIIIIILKIYKASDAQCSCSPPADWWWTSSWAAAPSRVYPWFTDWAWPYILWNISLARWDQLFWLCSLTDSCASPASSLVVWIEKQKGPWFRIRTAQEQHWWVTNIILILNLKHSIVPATRKIINLIPIETRTVFYSKLIAIANEKELWFKLIGNFDDRWFYVVISWTEIMQTAGHSCDMYM